MKLDEIAEKTGGHAMAEHGVTRIKAKDISATLKHFSKVSGIPVNQLHLVGSAGKIATSGDIDVAIDVNEHSAEEIHAKIVSKLGNEHSTYNKGTGVGSYVVPIRGDESNGLVQLDLMFTSNVELAKFTYHSEGEGSKYKGAIRTILLQAVASAINVKGTDHFEYDTDGSLLIRAGRTLDLSVGLRRIFQHRPKKKRGDGYVKTLKSIPIEDFKEQFPNIEVNNGQVVVDDPAKVVKVLFGGSVTPSDVKTAEQVLQLIKQKFNEEQQEKIFMIAKSRVKGYVGKMRLPQELTDEVE